MTKTFRCLAMRVTAAVFAVGTPVLATSQESAPVLPEASPDNRHFATAEEYIEDLHAHSEAMEQQIRARAAALQTGTELPPSGHPDRTAILAYTARARHQIATIGAGFHRMTRDIGDFVAYEQGALSRCPRDRQAYLRAISAPMFDHADQVVARMDKAADNFVRASNANFDLGERLLQTEPTEQNMKQYKESPERDTVMRNLEASATELRSALDDVMAFDGASLLDEAAAR